MIKLDVGNVLLKPSQRRQLMAWLRRAIRMGERLGNFILNISIVRMGKHYEVRAAVSDSMGNFGCRSRQAHWRDAFKELAQKLSSALHAQMLARPM